MVKNRKEQSFKEALAEIENPKNRGQGSWSLPRNATPAEKTKYEICEKILGYQEDKNLSDEVMARQLHLTISETEDILFCRISKFTLDYLMNVASKLFSPAEIKVTIESVKDTTHVRTF
jgi:predicted XRE-type DNA-binding protein